MTALGVRRYLCSAVDGVTLELPWVIRVKAEARSLCRLIAHNEMLFPTNVNFTLVFLLSVCKLAFNLATIPLLVVLVKHFIVAVVFLN